VLSRAGKEPACPAPPHPCTPPSLATRDTQALPQCAKKSDRPPLLETLRAQISALVANAPYLSGSGNIVKALKERGLLRVLQLVTAAVIDQVRALGRIFFAQGATRVCVCMSVCGMLLLVACYLLYVACCMLLHVACARECVCMCACVCVCM